LKIGYGTQKPSRRKHNLDLEHMAAKASTYNEIVTRILTRTKPHGASSVEEMLWDSPLHAGRKSACNHRNFMGRWRFAEWNRDKLSPQVIFLITGDLECQLLN
jgi:hypothetical protein